MTLGRKQEVFTLNVAKLIFFANELGFGCRARELQRKKELQKQYVEQGKSKTMKSNHLNSTAIDIYFSKDDKIVEDKEELQVLGDFWESLDPKNKWGGNYKSFYDSPHFEMDSY